MKTLIDKTRNAGLAGGLLLLLSTGIALAQEEDASLDAAAENTEAAVDSGPTGNQSSIPPMGPLDTPAQLSERNTAGKGEFSVTGDYQVVYLSASESLGEEDDAFGGIGRLLLTYGFWQDTDHPGAIYSRIETRDALGTELPPEDLGLAGLGYLGLTAADYADIGLGVPELFWKQEFTGKVPVHLRIGKIAPASFFDITAFSDQLTGFINLGSILSQTTPYQGTGLGMLGYVGVSEKLYLKGFFIDLNGEWDGLGDIGEGKLWKGLEFGYTGYGSRGAWAMDNTHISYWHRDRFNGAPSAEGVSIAHSRYFPDSRWGGFIRAGYASDVALMNKSAAIGVTKHFGEGDDSTGKTNYGGIAVSWGEPFGDLDNQWATEIFYRFQLGDYFAVTPMVQLLFDPALNPDEDQIVVWGLRVRFAP